MDNARQWGALSDLKHNALRTPRQYQQEAIEAWRSAHRRGTVILPTGAGKTLCRYRSRQETKRPTMVVTPTLDSLGSGMIDFVHLFSRTNFNLGWWISRSSAIDGDDL